MRLTLESKYFLAASLCCLLLVGLVPTTAMFGLVAVALPWAWYGLFWSTGATVWEWMPGASTDADDELAYDNYCQEMDSWLHEATGRQIEWADD